MEKEVKELRIKIDGLAQLAKSLKPETIYTLDLSYLPENWELDKFMYFFEEKGYAILDSQGKDASKVITPIKGFYKEINNAVDSLLLTKAWLGKVLEELGATNPYKSGYKTVEDIEPTADVAKNLTVDFDGGWEEMNHIERVDWLRKEIKQVIKNLPDTKPSSRLEAIAWTNTYNYLSEARFWLGFELQRIKESKTND